MANSGDTMCPALSPTIQVSDIKCRLAIDLVSINRIPTSLESDIEFQMASRIQDPVRRYVSPMLL